jgi:hypothetical protein
MNTSKVWIIGTGLAVTVGAGSMIAPALSADRYCPNYRSALSNLNQARNDLNEASGDVKGNRLDAVYDIERAIANVKDAMRVKRCKY